MIKTHNKLIRDNILDIIEKSGKLSRSRVLDKEEYINCLNVKLLEEVNEYLSANSESEIYEELADVFEVLESLIKACNIDKEKLLEIKEKKKMKNGGFDKKIFLIDVDDCSSEH